MVYFIFLAILALFALHEMYQRSQARRAERADPGGVAAAAERKPDGAGAEHATRVSQARSELAAAYQPKQLDAIKVQPVGDMPTESVFTLHETSLQSLSGRHDVTAATRADVDTAAGIMVTGREAIERIGLGTTIRGPVGSLIRAADGDGAPDDRGQHYFLLQGEDWVDSAGCGKAQQQRLGEFAEQVNLAAADVDRVRAERAERVKGLQATVDRVTRDRSTAGRTETTRAAS